MDRTRRGGLDPPQMALGRRCDALFAAARQASTSARWRTAGRLLSWKAFVESGRDGLVTSCMVPFIIAIATWLPSLVK